MAINNKFKDKMVYITDEETNKALVRAGIRKMKLKTFKEIQKEYFSNVEINNQEIFRKEVILWLKDMKTEKPYGKATKSVILWIKIFFDIKDNEIN